MEVSLRCFAHSRKIAILKIWSWCILFVQSYLENLLCHQEAAKPVLPTDNTPPVCRYITEIWPVLMACTWKIAFCLQRSGSKHRSFIWAKQSTVTTWRAVMVHSECHITLLLASFDVALPSESKKQSWIDWTIQISPSMCWFLLDWFPAHMSRFQVSQSWFCWCLWNATAMDVASGVIHSYWAFFFWFQAVPGAPQYFVSDHYSLFSWISSLNFHQIFQILSSAVCHGSPHTPQSHGGIKHQNCLYNDLVKVVNLWQFQHMVAHWQLVLSTFDVHKLKTHIPLLSTS